MTETNRDMPNGRTAEIVWLSFDQGIHKIYQKEYRRAKEKLRENAEDIHNLPVDLRRIETSQPRYKERLYQPKRFDYVK